MESLSAYISSSSGREDRISSTWKAPSSSVPAISGSSSRQKSQMASPAPSGKAPSWNRPSTTSPGMIEKVFW